jgi:hypothetical protein
MSDQLDFSFRAEPRLFFVRFLLRQFGYVSRPGKDKHGRFFRVHAAFCGLPLCGGGRDASRTTVWQTEIAPSSCKACERLTS